MPTRENLASELADLHSQLLRIPTLFDIDEYSDTPVDEYFTSFSTLDDALVEAGVLQQLPMIPTMDLIDELYRVMDEVGQNPTRMDLDSYGKYSSSTYQNRFGSWSDALVAARIEPQTYGPHSKAELISAVKKLATQINKPPTPDQVALLTMIEPNEFTRQFGPWDDFLHSIGLDDTE